MSREENPLEPQSPAQDPCESGSRDNFDVLDFEQRTGERAVGGDFRSERLKGKARLQVYELRGGAKRSEILREEARYRKYGITGEDVAVLLLAQSGVCVGCGVAFGVEVNFVIDHDHDSGKVRGLLCRECNIVLAHWMTPGKLRRLAKYLEDA